MERAMYPTTSRPGLPSPVEPPDAMTASRLGRLPAIAALPRTAMRRFVMWMLAAAHYTVISAVMCTVMAQAPAPVPQVAAPAAPAASLPPVPTPEEAKAAHVHKFAAFVEWPVEAFASGDAPLVVGVAGAPALARELIQISFGKPAQGRAMQVRELTDLADAARVHILVIGRASWKRAVDWMAATKGRPVLVVTDMPKGLERGAALCLVETEGKLRFEASVLAAERAGLRLSARLLSVAERVVRAP